MEQTYALPMAFPEPGSLSRAGQAARLGERGLDRYSRKSFFGSRAQIQVAGGTASAQLAFVGYDRRGGIASYAVRFSNESSMPLRARLCCAKGRHETALDYPSEIEIAPFSIKDEFLPVRVGETGPYDRAIVEIEGTGVAFRVEAPGPPEPRPRIIGYLQWAAASVVCLGIAAFGLAAAAPRIVSFDAPPKMTAGTTLQIPYVLGGVGTLQYDVRAAGGRQVAAGMVPASAGIVQVAIPASRGARTYRVDLRMTGPLGSVRRSASVVALSSARKPAAPGRSIAPGAVASTLIGALSVSPAPVRAGGPLRVAYTATASSGKVWLLGLGGRVWATAPFASDGTSLLRVPANAAGREMRVVLQVRDGARQAMSSVGVVVEPHSSAVVGAALPGVPPDSSATRIDLSQSRVASGENVTVRIVGPHDDVRVTLTDARGQTLEQGDASAQEDAVALGAPAVASPTTFYVVAAISRGVSQTSVVRKLIVTP
ncbi:MAG: hypothetical protein ACYCUI_10635 [Vulcanimicrobiaceae bacterium]